MPSPDPSYDLGPGGPGPGGSPSYASGASQVPLLGDTIGGSLRRAAARWPGREALVDLPTGRRWSYAGLDHDVDTVARGLLALGVTRGDRVGIWAPNCPEWLLGQYATARIGAILVTVNPAYRSHELAYVIRQSGMRMLLSTPTFKGSDYRAMVGQVRADCPDLEHVVWIGEPSWDDLLAGGSAVPPADLTELAGRLGFDDPINIQYTSGTTGSPKGATLSHHNILNNGFFVGELCRYTEQDRICVPVPFYHCFGMVMGNLAALTHGACVVIPASAFDPVATLHAVAAERCTSLYGVPTMFIAQLGAAEFGSYDLSSLRTGIMAGSPCPAEVMRQVIADMGMAEVTICYGMTETSPVSTQSLTTDDPDRRVSTVGRVHPHLEIMVADPQTGLPVPRGQSGEFRTRGYSVMLGYWDEPERTAEAIDSAGWMHTGDLAEMDDEGFVRIVGRIKDLVIRGGENIYPREIEEFLYRHPAVQDVQVVGVPDARYGEELYAAVIGKPGVEVTEDELREFCRGQIAHYKVPRYVRLVDAFPMTITGKVQKYKMRAQAVEMLGLAPD